MGLLPLVTTLVMLICVYMTAKQYVLSWVPNLIACFLMMVYYYQIGFYAQVMLQVVFILQCFYGFFNWKKEEEVEVHRIKAKDVFIHLICALILGLAFVKLFEPDESILSYADGISAFIGLLANTYLTRKIIQTWTLWMFYNILLIVTFSLMSDYVMIFLNIVLFIQSLIAYKAWKKDLKTV